jgi:murein L,D-transpeptidase YcbB/YkuD
MAKTLVQIINEDEVLKPYKQNLFKLDEINTLINNIQTTSYDLNKLIKLDIMLTSTYHEYMRYLSKGLIDWDKFQEELVELNEEKEIIANWKKYNVRKNIRKLLYKAVKENDIKLAINKVNYTFPKAQELSNLIKEYENIAQNGGYTKVPKVKKNLRKGNYYTQIKELRQRLFQSKDLEYSACLEEPIIETKNLISNNLFKKETQVTTTRIDSETATVEINKVTEAKPAKDCLELYDENIFHAVKSFQKNHGLIQDGIVGKNTIIRLNIPIDKKIRKMRINLERMRWMPRTLGKKYLIVNIPDYKLKMYKDGEVTLDMPVVVGKYKNPTPIFSHKMSAIVLNPYWKIPQRIVKREIVPKLVEDPNYLVSKEIKVFENWNHESMEYDTSSVDWSMYLDNDLIGTSVLAPMRFIQIPSNKNPLGRMKFMFPNRYSVYLHDTPFKKLFNRNKRAFSHGCIRLSRPHDLLKTIALDDKQVDYDEAKEILEDIKKTDLNLTKTIPVHIIYLTSWIDEDGKAQFRDDIYKYDKIQGNILYNKSL